jgi:deoxycytidylate deaminase
MSLIDRGFDAAFAASELSDAPYARLKMGACLLAGSRLLSVGANRWCSHPCSGNTKEFNRTLHAEAVALLRRQYFDRPSGHMTLFVARRLADGSIGNSRPCFNCMRLCKEAGIARIWFYENGERKECKL